MWLKERKPFKMVQSSPDKVSDQKDKTNKLWYRFA